MFSRKREVIQVLLVDDEPDLIRKTKLFIEKAYPAIQIDLCWSPEEAWHLFQEKSYDCVVSELLHRMEGIELARKVKENNNIPFIIYTGIRSKKGVEATFTTEIDDYVIKESDPSHYRLLAKKIRAVVKRYEIEEMLREFEEFFGRIAEESFDVIFRLDEGGHISYISPSVERIIGYKPEEIVGTIFQNFIPEEDLPKATKAFSKVIKGAKVEGLNLKLIMKDGTHQNVEINVFPIRRDGKVLGAQGVFRDTHLIASESRFRSLVELAPDGIVTLNLKGFITSGNKALFELTGFSEDELIGKHFTKIGTIRLQDVPKYIKIFSSVLRKKEPEPFEFMYVRKDGSNAWGHGLPKLIRIGGRKREIILILRDITQRKQNEDNLKKAMEELELSNRELDDYTYAVSHDLKAPLRTIEAFSGFLLEDYAEKLDETGKEYLKRMMGASVRMKTLIDDLLTLSRVGRIHTETEKVDLNNLLQEIEQDFEVQIKERGAQLLVDRLPTIKTQRVWMRQLFSNLISNGLKFNKSPNPRVEVGCEERPSDYLFSVMDNGIGIKKSDQKKIFRIFQRLHTQEEYPGTGAGLATCKKIVESFGGNIWVESKPGAGSTFYFTYPKERIDQKEAEYYPEIDQGILSRARWPRSV